MRRFAALLFCILFLFITGGYHLLFRISISEAKAAIKKQLRNQELPHITIFSFDKNEMKQLSWEDDEEFSLRGEMYDVIDKQFVEGKTVIRCISDKKETALVSAWQKLQNHNSSGRNTSGSLLKLLSLVYCPASFTCLPEPLRPGPCRKPGYVLNFVTAYPQVQTPPPKYC
jgi:hypothetical protein